MSAAFGAAAGDVFWSLGFLVRYAWVIVPLAAIPAAQRVFASLHPDDPRVYAWPIELLVTVVRLGTIALVFWLGWRDDEALREDRVNSAGDVFGALAGYIRQDWPRLVAGLVIATAVFIVLNLLAGPVVEVVVGLFTDDARSAQAWSFGIRNLLIIPVFYAFAYGLARPAFLTTVA